MDYFSINGVRNAKKRGLLSCEDKWCDLSESSQQVRVSVCPKVCLPVSTCSSAHASRIDDQ